ncbi:MAG: hypothetical protein IT287_05855 [Bdellovibrionaceae bacterium]|nr:hypothetical protein [Pseudobdellovibrionaceae bacterium]
MGLLFTLLVVVGCSPSTPKKIPFVENKPEQSSEVGNISKESFRPDLDILFIIDDSGSMGVHQANVAANASLFADAIVKTKFLDYHVVVITSSIGPGFTFPGTPSSPGGGKLFGKTRYVDRTTPNGLFVLAENIQVGTNGDATEQFFDPLELALSQPLVSGYNGGFLRPDSYLALIFVTDTDDQSKKNDAQSIFDFLVKLKGNANKIFVGAAFIPDAEAAVCSGESDIGTSDNLPDFFRLTKAITFSLCDPDFGEKLAEIGRVIARRAQTMYLKKIPKKGTIKVIVGSAEIPNDAKSGWTYNPVVNGIEFGPNIDWEVFPDNTFPQVDFEAIEIPQPDLNGVGVTVVPAN